MSRPGTGAGNLVRLGFQDADTALSDLRLLGADVEPLLAPLSRTADPDAALAGLVRLREAAEDGDALIEALTDDEGTAMRLLSVLGASQPLTDHLVRHAERKLGCRHGGTSPDGKVTLKVEEECLAACAGAPMMVIDGHYHERLTPAKLDELFDALD